MLPLLLSRLLFNAPLFVDLRYRTPFILQSSMGCCTSANTVDEPPKKDRSAPQADAVVAAPPETTAGDGASLRDRPLSSGKRPLSANKKLLSKRQTSFQTRWRTLMPTSNSTIDYFGVHTVARFVGPKDAGEGAAAQGSSTAIMAGSLRGLVSMVNVMAAENVAAGAGGHNMSDDSVDEDLAMSLRVIHMKSRAAEKRRQLTQLQFASPGSPSSGVMLAPNASITTPEPLTAAAAGVSDVDRSTDPASGTCIPAGNVHPQGLGEAGQHDDAGDERVPPRVPITERAAAVSAARSKLHDSLRGADEFGEQLLARRSGASSARAGTNSTQLTSALLLLAPPDDDEDDGEADDSDRRSRGTKRQVQGASLSPVSMGAAPSRDQRSSGALVGGLPPMLPRLSSGANLIAVLSSSSMSMSSSIFPPIQHMANPSSSRAAVDREERYRLYDSEEELDEASEMWEGTQPLPLPTVFSSDLRPTTFFAGAHGTVDSLLTRLKAVRGVASSHVDQPPDGNAEPPQVASRRLAPSDSDTTFLAVDDASRPTSTLQARVGELAAHRIGVVAKIQNVEAASLAVQSQLRGGALLQLAHPVLALEMAETHSRAALWNGFALASRDVGASQFAIILMHRHAQQLDDTFHTMRVTLACAVQRLEGIGRLAMSRESWWRAMRLAEMHHRDIVRCRSAISEQQRRDHSEQLRADRAARAHGASVSARLRDHGGAEVVGPPDDVGCFKAVSPCSAQQTFFAELDRLKSAEAAGRVLQPIDEQKVASHHTSHSSVNASRLPRHQRVLVEAVYSLEATERRHRDAIATEEGARFSSMHDGAVSVAPAIVAHPYRDAIVARQRAVVVAAKTHSTRKHHLRHVALPAVSPRSSASVCDAALTTLLGRMRSLEYDGDADSHAIRLAEDAQWLELSSVARDDFWLVLVHDSRRQEQRSHAERMMKLAQQFGQSQTLIARVALGWLWRHRVAPLRSVAEVLRPLLQESDRDVRLLQTQRRLQIEDILLFCRATVPAKTSGMALGEDCEAAQSTPTVEACCRETLRDGQQEARETLVREFWARADFFSRLPIERRGYRIRAAIILQAAARRFLVRRRLSGGWADELMLARGLRIHRRMAIRALGESEGLRRLRIEDEEFLFLRRESFLRIVHQHQREVKAATIIQAAFRGHHFRHHGMMSETQIAYWRQRIAACKARNVERKTAREGTGVAVGSTVVGPAAAAVGSIPKP